MSENLISVKSYLGKYYSELLQSAQQAKYKDTQLDLFFEQRFYMQSNKVQMVVEPDIPGLEISVCGNEIHVSHALYNHANVVITNSMETGKTTNPQSLYNPDTFSTLAYLICQNHTSFKIVGELDEPIYVKYSSDYETFYNSVLVFSADPGLDVEIVEEFNSCGALNSVTNYIMYPDSTINLTTFYNNRLSAVSFCYRNIIEQQGAKFNHILYGRGSSNIIDENRICNSSNSETEMLGIVDSAGRKFHSILYVESDIPNYGITVDYKDILQGNGDVTFLPVITGVLPLGDNAIIDVADITIEELPVGQYNTSISAFISAIVGRTILDRTVSVSRFYESKAKFLAGINSV